MNESGERELRLPDGTLLAVGVSALIKSLRRGNELESLYWARRIEAGGFWRYLFRRLGIFATEDVGLANATAVTVVQACLDAYERCKKESRGPVDANLITHCVRLLALSEKNRENDDLKNVEIELRHSGWKPEVPEIAIDWHTPQGRTLFDDDSGLVMWLTVWSKVVPDVGPCDWKLWHWRQAVKAGLLDGTKVEAQAVEWDQAGRLRYGINGPDID